ncbi:serine/threonine-protein kinase [Engelhardtia mirabilis]|uniref:Serine/threonine-protein kinase StkP n=1 Tax=Engelhardtia mirabilis TaxID=2528011 RepID=A0A518BRR3_9BACT|nr:Serine/threonine-protein kinase StkP [Planctomycetes bacterium Pla133]QDV03985.1 Serine/threonine-protein kinase StkP [Planctomycetes bacterium Pla86]
MADSSFPLPASDEEELFHGARERTDPAARREFLDRHCAERPELRAFVEGLLAADAEAEGFLSGADGTELGPGDGVGAYRLLERLGSGGGGEVFLARRDGTDLPAAALKVLRGSRAGGAFLDGFDLERRALALMDHPAIARLIDAGVTEDGRPFLVMERVDGAPLTRYADERGLALRERLVLLRQVALAVDHAHGNGVVHRDLKPANVLVAHVDGKPVPKVIDFGVASAAALGEEGGLGRSAFVGTPQYMAPEQALAPGPDDVDGRADVFALGVLLFELVTGTTPSPAKEFAGLDLAELRRRVGQRVPIVPSQRLAELGQIERCAVDVTHLRQICERDIDAIVRRATEGDPGRRHPTAAAFARELERAERALDPVTRFQGSRLSGVDPAQLGSTMRSELLLAATAGLERAGFADDRRADLLAGLEAGLEHVNFTTVARRVSTLVVFDPASEAIDAELSAEPLVQATLLQSQGEALLKLGLFERATTPLARAVDLRREGLGLSAPETLESLKSYGVCLRSLGRLIEARPFYEACLEGWTAVAGEDDQRTIDAHNNLGVLVMNEGDWVASERHFRRAVESGRRALGADSITVVRALSNLGAVLEQLGRTEEAARAYREGLAGSRAVHGADDIHTLSLAGNHARLLSVLGDHETAVEQLTDLAARARLVLGDEHVNTLLMLVSLGRAQLDAGRAELALSTLEEALAGLEAQFGREHELVMAALSDVAGAAREMGQVERAVALGADGVARSEGLPLGHPRRGAILLSYGRALVAAGEGAQGFDVVRRACELLESAVGPDHLEVHKARGILAKLEAAGAGNKGEARS